VKTSLHRRILQTIKRHAMLHAGTRVGVAVSGGADSVALLFLLNEMRSELGVTLRVLHFNHQLREAEADADASFVQELSKRLGLPCTVESQDVRAVAQQEKWNLEDAARRVRQQFFAAAIAKGLADVVAVAHTADDQAETVLMHLLRGAGISGLAGIHPVAGVMIRPLIDVRRAGLRAYLQARVEAWREDSSNTDTTRLRARIRHQLLPLITRGFAPTAVERLASLAQIAREESALWDDVLQPILDAKAVPTASGCKIRISHIQFPFRSEPAAPGAGQALPGGEAFAGTVAPAALQKKIIRVLIKRARGHLRGITAQHIDQVFSLTATARGGCETHLPGLRVRRDLRSHLSFQAAPVETTAADSSYLYHVALPHPGQGTVCVPESEPLLRLKLFDCAEQGRDTRNGAEALDRDLLRGSLTLRNWRPGDAYRPQGRAGRHKLKRLFWEQGIPVQARAAWPVLLSGEAIVWSRRFGVAAEFAATGKSRAAICIIEDES